MILAVAIALLLATLPTLAVWGLQKRTIRPTVTPVQSVLMRRDDYWVDVYAAGRGGGKTTWLLQKVDEAIMEGLRVAVVCHDQRRADHVQHHNLRGSPTDVYSERSFEWSRGRLYDRIYVDEANLFHDNPVETSRQYHPGVPVTLTYTPYPFGP